MKNILLIFATIFILQVTCNNDWVIYDNCYDGCCADTIGRNKHPRIQSNGNHHFKMSNYDCSLTLLYSRYARFQDTYYLSEKLFLRLITNPRSVRKIEVSGTCSYCSFIGYQKQFRSTEIFSLVLDKEVDGKEFVLDYNDSDSDETHENLITSQSDEDFRVRSFEILCAPKNPKRPTRKDIADIVTEY